MLRVSLLNHLAVCLALSPLTYGLNPNRIHRLTLCLGASAILGYSLKGIDAEINKGATQKIFGPIVSARMPQGELEYLELREEEKKDIIQQ